MNVDGWAYTKNEVEGAQDNATMEFHSVVVKNIADFIVLENRTSGYAHCTYRGYLKPGCPPLTVKELLVFFDGGNLCFGGRGTINGDKFEVAVYTD